MNRLSVFSEHHVYRAGLRCLLKSLGIAEMVTECSAAAELPDHLRSVQPGLAVVDINQDFHLGLLEEIAAAAPSCKLLFLASDIAPELFYHLVQSGDHGIVNRRAPMGIFMEYLQAALDGRGRSDPTVCSGGSRDTFYLSPREGELVSLLAQGLKNKEIAATLNISEGTVKVYLSHLYAKLRVKDRFELALYALKNLSALGQGLRLPDQESGAGAQRRGGVLLLDWKRREGGMRRPLARRREAAI